MQGTPVTYILRKYWMAIVLIALLSTVVAYAASYLVSPSYSGTAHVLMRIRDIRYSSATGQDQSKQTAVVDTSLVKTLAETSSNLVTSQAVAEQVVNELHLDQPKPIDSAWFSQVRAALKQAYKVALSYVRYGYYAEPPAHAGAVAAVQGALAAAQLKDSYTIEIKALADDPQLAADMANSAANAFVAVSRDRTRQESDQYRAAIKTSVDAALKRVNDADNAIRTYREDNGIVDLAEQLRLSANNQDAARKALSDIDAQLRDSRARKDSVEQAMSNTDVTIASTTSVQTHNTTTAPQTTTGTITVTSDPATSTMATGRSSTTTTSDPSTSTTRNNLTVDQHSDSSTSEDHQTTNPNPVYQGLQGTSLQLDTEIAGLEARRSQAQAALDASIQEASNLPRNDATMNGLKLEADSARTAYGTVRATYDAATVDAQSQTTDGTLIDSATPPLYPDKPWRWLFALFGLFIGGLLGVAIGFGVESWPRGGAPAALPLKVSPDAPGLALASQILPPASRADSGG